MTTKFLKTYLWAFAVLAFLFVAATVVAFDGLAGISIYSHSYTILTVFSLPALISILAFITAKIINLKSAKLFRWKFSAILLDLAIVLVSVALAIIYIKIREKALLSALLDFGNIHFLLILSFAVLTALLVILLKISAISLKENIAALNWDKLGGKFFLIFYLATILFSLFSILIAFVGYQYNYSYSYSNLSESIIFSILCFTLAVALAAFLSAAADFLNKVSKSISVLLLALFLGVVVFGSILYFALASYGADSQYFSATQISEYGVVGEYDDSAVPEVVPEEYYEREEYYEGDGESLLDENNKLAFLWNDVNDDADSIKAAIKFGLKEFPTNYIEHLNSNFDLLKAYEYADDTWNYTGEKGGLAYHRIINYISRHRSDIPLKTLADAYWSQIKNSISIRIYKEKKLDELVDMLLRVHQDLYNEEDESPYQNFYHINRIMSAHNYNWVWEYYPHIKKYISEENLPETLKSSEGNINESLTTWAYSFWGRRYAEGNVEDVYLILRKLQQAY
ncbi:MAG: hypothetical protein LBN27_02970 [Prevotellaceae bacterium]|jgi:hypothetical protein|nr:hypothetical protein [Prevotellaceae bacterium]